MSKLDDSSRLHARSRAEARQIGVLVALGVLGLVAFAVLSLLVH